MTTTKLFFLQVGKLYQVKLRWRKPGYSTETAFNKFAVYNSDQGDLEPLLSFYKWLRSGDVIMWLGTQECTTGWARLLRKDRVWFVRLSTAKDALERAGGSEAVTEQQQQQQDNSVLQPGKLYKISFDRAPEDALVGGEKLMTGLVVYKDLPTPGEATSGWWNTISGPGVVMWLGTQGVPDGWAKLLHEDKVWYIWLESHHNLKRLKRVK